MNETSSGHFVPRRNFLKLCAVAGGLTLFPWLAYASEADDLEAKADQLEADKNQLQAQASDVEARLNALQDQYNKALVRYNDAVSAHDEAVAAMEDAKTRIEIAEARIAELQDQLGHRVNVMYKHGTSASGFLDVLMGSSSFEEFTTNLDAMERVSEQDARLVQDSKDAKAEAQAAHDEYSRQEAIAAEEVANAEKAKDELEAAQASLQQEYDSMNADIAARQAEIEQIRMDADEARQREEEAKKAAEQALQQQAGGGSSSTPSISVDGWVNPAPGKYITSGFGWRPSIGDYHQGVDLSCRFEPVYCMADGVVTTAGWFGTGGLAVTVNHGGGIVSWYLHGSSLNVSVGQHVSAGQNIMTSGNTGFSTGAHLHFQINVNSPDGVSGTAVNPTAYFSW